MAKKNRGGEQQNSKVTESMRNRIAQLLTRFKSADDEVYTFEAGLSNLDRAEVHQQCRKMGMKSKSKGSGKKRVVSVYKPKKKAAASDVIPKLTHLTFSGVTKEVLRDLFMRYPPGDEVGREMYGTNSNENVKAKRKKDSMFCKPSMTKAEIAKKVESLASRIKNSDKLRKITEEKSKLPITSYRDVITSAVESHQVILISGETGCGKTTQVPQFILDHMWGKGEACKIVCTQPRRISAASVAERISKERGGNVGEDIGYKIRLESQGGRHSSIVLCTNGILLRLLVSRGTGRSKAGDSNKETKQDDNDITHIIVDEIHERDHHSDLMLAIIRDMLSSHPHLHLILMSATVDAERFSHYFGGCPIIRVPGFTYPVKTFYLEDVLSILKSVENNHLNTAVGLQNEDPDLTQEFKLVLDEAINLAWSNDEFDPLLELASSERTRKVFNYQHSLTGLTPLMVFAGKGRTTDVCMLLSFGADCQLRANDGATALELAEREEQRETAEILKVHIENALSNSMKEQLLIDRYLQYFNPENVDFVLIEQLLRKICSDSNDGAILVFLPGWDDIKKTQERLLMNPYFRNTSKVLIISLHSMVPSNDQKMVFKRPPPGCRKIVLSTNMAETAITIDDVVYVIDSGRMKEKNYDPYNNVSSLQSSWVSKASAKQRRGRAGRCQPGICYHLYSKVRAASLPDFQVPEIRRMPIEGLCLQVKLLDPDCNIEDFLIKTLDPPRSETIHNAVAVLQDIGALSLDEKLTVLGEKLGSLPVHPLTSKMLFFSILMNCLDPALTLACATDFKDPFSLPMLPDDRKRAAAAKYELASLYGGHSDQLAVIAAFDIWKTAKKRRQEELFCSQYFVSSSTMHMLSRMRKQLQAELNRHGFIPDDVSRCSLNAHNPGILRAVLVAGLYPMVGRLVPARKKMKRSVVETPNGVKVCLNNHSMNYKLAKVNSDDRPLIMFDEITRGDAGVMNIRNCTVIGPLPLLFLSTEISVAPSNNDDDDGYVDEGSDVDDNEDESDEDAMEIDGKSGGQHKDKIMSSPDNSVTVIVDRWLQFGSKALDVAQIYCLRERLSAAILFKVTHPRKVLPPGLGASVYAIACALSYDGLSGISIPKESEESPTSVENETVTEDSVEPLQDCYLHKSIMCDILRDDAHGSNDINEMHCYFLRSCAPAVNAAAHHRPLGTDILAANGKVRFYVIGNGAAKLRDPSSHSVQPPLDSAPITAHQKPPSQGPNLVGNGPSTDASDGPRGESPLQRKKRRNRGREQSSLNGI
ncbi:DExH-box ATP-dependent RNA helicase DExH6-like [Prunus avium]|uniref:DExH-box ATP-dependent RNA helicase DExH6-like n=1 Tax=Prunus avium TaxID=42229 RepID=A0A6P5TCR4_PRUAV|nr:DExH-box ATP-dependent RNA helicase DExH6-like [Prunus avium]